MSLATAELPTDPAELHAFALACQSELKVAELSVQYKALEIEKLKLQIAKLRRMQFGRSSERISRQIEQLELRLEELETGEAESAAKTEAEVDTAEPVAPIRERNKPKRKPLPDHLPRQEVVHQPADDGACKCPDCGKGMAKLGEDNIEGFCRIQHDDRTSQKCGPEDGVGGWRVDLVRAGRRRRQGEMAGLRHAPHADRTHAEAGSDYNRNRLGRDEHR
jgi:hypothetical protein